MEICIQNNNKTYNDGQGEDSTRTTTSHSTTKKKKGTKRTRKNDKKNRKLNIQENEIRNTTETTQTDIHDLMTTTTISEFISLSEKILFIEIIIERNICFFLTFLKGN